MCRFTRYHTCHPKVSLCKEYFDQKRYFLLFFLQLCKIFLFLCGVQYVRFGTKGMDGFMEVIAEYANISCMYYVSCTRYLQVSLFWLYVSTKVEGSLLFCVTLVLFFCCFSIAGARVSTSWCVLQLPIILDHTINVVDALIIVLDTIGVNGTRKRDVGYVSQWKYTISTVIPATKIRSTKGL